MDAYQYGHGFSRQVLFLREQAEKRFLDAFDTREDLTRQVKAALQANPDLLGLSLVFEANALDGKDELFANQAELGSNDKGRFALYWSQPTPGKLTAMALPESDMSDTSIGPSGEKANAWFTCPRTTLKPCVIEPYFYVDRRPKRTDDQPRVPADSEWQSHRLAVGGHQPQQPAGGEPAGEPHAV